MLITYQVTHMTITTHQPDIYHLDTFEALSHIPASEDFVPLTEHPTMDYAEFAGAAAVKNAVAETRDAQADPDVSSGAEQYLRSLAKIRAGTLAVRDDLETPDQDGLYTDELVLHRTQVEADRDEARAITIESERLFDYGVGPARQDSRWQDQSADEQGQRPHEGMAFGEVLTPMPRGQENDAYDPSLVMLNKPVGTYDPQRPARDRHIRVLM
jgi:hypothetical protein